MTEPTLKALLDSGGPLAALMLIPVLPLFWLILKQIKVQESEGLANREMIQKEGEANRKLIHEVSSASAQSSHQVVTALHELRDMFIRLDGRLSKS